MTNKIIVVETCETCPLHKDIGGGTHICTHAAAKEFMVVMTALRDNCIHGDCPLANEVMDNG